MTRQRSGECQRGAAVAAAGPELGIAVGDGASFGGLDALASKTTGMCVMNA